MLRIGIAAAVACLSTPSGIALAQNADLQLDIQLEWVSPPCAMPAKFRATFSNRGEATFWIPRDDYLGFRRSVNIIAKQGDDLWSTSGYFVPPRRQGFWQDAANFVELHPGEGHQMELSFDGTFTAHGGQVEPPDVFEGELRLAYTLPTPFSGEPQGDFGPILFENRTDPVVSNILNCPP